MLGRLIKAILIIPLLMAAMVLVIIGLIDFDFLVALIAKLIVAIVIVGVFVLIVKRVFFPR